VYLKIVGNNDKKIKIIIREEEKSVTYGL